MVLDGLPWTVIPPPAVTVIFELLIPKSNQQIYEVNPHTYVTKMGLNSLHWFLRYGVHKVFGTHRLTHGQTHPKTECLWHRRFLVAQA